MREDQVLVLGQRDIARLLDLESCIEAVETAFRMLGEGRMSPGPFRRGFKGKSATWWRA